MMDEYAWRKQYQALLEDVQKLCYDYEQLSLKLCETEGQLAAARGLGGDGLPELGSAEWWRLIAEGRGNIMGEYRAERDEAREIAEELFAFARQIMRAHTKIDGNIRAYVWHAEAKDAFGRIRPGVRKALEK